MMQEVLLQHSKALAGFPELLSPLQYLTMASCKSTCYGVYGCFPLDIWNLILAHLNFVQLIPLTLNSAFTSTVRKHIKNRADEIDRTRLMKYNGWHQLKNRNVGAFIWVSPVINLFGITYLPNRSGERSGRRAWTMSASLGTRIPSTIHMTERTL